MKMKTKHTEHTFEFYIDKAERMFYTCSCKKRKTRPHHTNGVGAPLMMDGSNTYIQTYIRMDERFEEQKRSHL